MNFTKSTLIVLFILLLSTLGYSQSQLNVSFGGSYGFGVFENSVETFVNTKEEENKYYNENKKFSLGGGLGIYANAVYHFGDIFGLGIGIHNHFNNEVVFIEVNSVSGIIAENKRTLSSKRFSILPMIEMRTNNEKINTFIQIGVSFNITNQKLNESITVDTSITEYYWDYEGKSKLGVFANWGLSYNFSEKLSIQFGLTLENFQYTPSQNNLSRLTINGENVSISGLQEIDKSVEFVDWVADQYSQYPDPNKPLQAPMQTFVYHNVSLFLGLNYRF